MPPIGYPGNSIRKAARAKAGGGFESAFEVAPVEPGINASGTVAHGEILTITDSEARFGTRTNVKPLYVNFGDSRLGSSLGRITDDVWRVSPAVTISSAFPVGQIATAIRVDMTESGTGGGTGFGPLILPSPEDAKPIIEYTERYYDFLNNAAGTTDASGPDGAGYLNLKINRVWAASDAGNNSLPDALCGYQFANNEAGDIAFYVEGQVAQPAGTDTFRFYSENLPFDGRVWVQDEHIFDQSSGIGVADGNLIHIRNGEEVNIATDNWITRDATYPKPFSRCYLDQISNGVGTENIIYYGYQCWDDEYNAVYVGDASTLATCTKLTRQPQIAWLPGEVQIQQVESQVTLSGSYLYFRTGIRSWVFDNGVALP